MLTEDPSLTKEAILQKFQERLLKHARKDSYQKYAENLLNDAANDPNKMVDFRNLASQAPNLKEAQVELLKCAGRKPQDGYRNNFDFIVAERLITAAYHLIRIEGQSQGPRVFPAVGDSFVEDLQLPDAGGRVSPSQTWRKYAIFPSAQVEGSSNRLPPILSPTANSQTTNRLGR